MSLRLAGEGDGGVQEVIERILYAPGLADSGDLEAATRTITATVEATGVANRDYQAALTLAAPGSAKLEVLRIAARLAVTIDGLGGDTNLYCRVYVDAQAANNRLFDLSWTTTGAKLAAVDTHAAALATIFNLLKDGGAHIFYFFFWKAGGGTGPVISLVQLWEGVGKASQVVSWPSHCLTLSHQGFFRVAFLTAREGSGTYESCGSPYPEDMWAAADWKETGLVYSGTAKLPTLLSPGIYAFGIWPTSVYTDLPVYSLISIVLRRLE